MTRAEYDDLKSRFDTLEATVARILPAFSVAAHPSTMSPNMPIASTSAVEAAHAPMMSPYRVQHTSSSPAYRLQSPQASTRGEPPYTAPSSLSSRSPQTAYRIPPGYPQPRPPRAVPSPPIAPRVPSPAPPLTSSSRLPDTRLPSSRRASLSLAAITTPYSPEPGPYGQPAAQGQPKNRRAQTLPLLGLRLRPASAQTGPAAGPRRHHHQARLSSCTDTSPAKGTPTSTRRLRRPRPLPRGRLPRATFRRQCLPRLRSPPGRFLIAVTPASLSATAVANNSHRLPHDCVQRRWAVCAW